MHGFPSFAFRRPCGYISKWPRPCIAVHFRNKVPQKKLVAANMQSRYMMHFDNSTEAVMRLVCGVLPIMDFHVVSLFSLGNFLLTNFPDLSSISLPFPISLSLVKASNDGLNCPS